MELEIGELDGRQVEIDKPIITIPSGKNCKLRDLITNCTLQDLGKKIRANTKGRNIKKHRTLAKFYKSWSLPP